MQFFQISKLNTILYLTKKNEFVPTLVYIIIKIYIFLILLDKERKFDKERNFGCEVTSLILFFSC